MDYYPRRRCGVWGVLFVVDDLEERLRNGYIRGRFWVDGLRPCCCKSRRNFAGDCRAFSVHTASRRPGFSTTAPGAA